MYDAFDDVLVMLFYFSRNDNVRKFYACSYWL